MVALSSLKVLILSHCTALRELPESLCELRELHTLNVEGCIGLAFLPKAISQLSGLKTLYVHNCHAMFDMATDRFTASNDLPSCTQIVREPSPKALK